MEHINPSTCVSVGNLKDTLEAVTLDTFGHDIKAFNAWFTNKQTDIIKEVGTEGYTKYLRCLFKMYRTAVDKEFLVTIAEERRKW
eukprot:6107416-Ditylum_brightwellii.AAC.1